MPKQASVPSESPSIENRNNLAMDEATLDTVDLAAALHPITDELSNVQKFSSDDDPAPGNTRAPKAAEPVEGNQGPAPDDAAKWRQLAYDNAKLAEGYRKEAELAARLRQNPNDPAVIEALMAGKGIDNMPLISQTGDRPDDLAELEEFLSGGQEAATPKATNAAANARKGQEQGASPPQGRQPDAQGPDDPAIAAAEEVLNQTLNSLAKDGYGEPVLFEFLQWLNGNGKPDVSDLFYAYLANKRRLGTPVQKSRTTPARQFGTPATAVTGQSGKPAIEGEAQPAYTPHFVSNPNDLSL